jgi:uncharacterized NAD-dependent epimerase/dehydratase family protein
MYNISMSEKNDPGRAKRNEALVAGVQSALTDPKFLKLNLQSVLAGVDNEEEIEKFAKMHGVEPDDVRHALEEIKK